MAKIKGVIVPRKAPSLKGNIVVSTWRGIPYIAKWPKKRKRPLPAITQEQNEWFRQANILTKYIAPDLQITAKDAVVGTPLYPRDVQVALMRGTLIGLELREDGKLFSLAVKQQVSNSLDVIGQTEGGILYRNADIWDVLPPGDEGEVLTGHGPGANPSWEPGGAGGGGAWEEIASIDAPVSGVFDFTGQDFSSYRELALVFTDLKPTVSEGFFDLQAYDNSTLVTSGYHWAYQAYSTSNFARTARSVSASAIALTGSGTNWGVAYTTYQGFSGTLRISNPTTAADRLVYWNGTHQQVTGNTNGYRGCGKIDIATVLNGFKISEPTNPIGSGEVKILGLAA